MTPSAGAETSVQLTIDPPISVQEIYLTVGELCGVNVLFDPKVKDQRLAIEIDAASAAEAFEPYWVGTESRIVVPRP